MEHIYKLKDKEFRYSKFSTCFMCRPTLFFYWLSNTCFSRSQLFKIASSDWRRSWDSSQKNGEEKHG